MVDSIRKPRGRSEQSLPHRVYYGGLDLQRVEPRNVFVLFDGTWNDEVEGSRTNVRKLWSPLRRTNARSSTTSAGSATTRRTACSGDLTPENRTRHRVRESVQVRVKGERLEQAEALRG